MDDVEKTELKKCQSSSRAAIIALSVFLVLLIIGLVIVLIYLFSGNPSPPIRSLPSISGSIPPVASSLIISSGSSPVPDVSTVFDETGLEVLWSSGVGSIVLRGRSLPNTQINEIGANVLVNGTVYTANGNQQQPEGCSVELLNDSSTWLCIWTYQQLRGNLRPDQVVGFSVVGRNQRGEESLINVTAPLLRPSEIL